MEKLKYQECENCADWNGNITHCMEMCGKPLDALQELKQFQSIGTVEECREAREKQVEKPVNIIPNHVFALQCPICGYQNTSICKSVGSTYYCSGCGQKLVYLLPESKGGD